MGARAGGRVTSPIIIVAAALALLLPGAALAAGKGGGVDSQPQPTPAFTPPRIQAAPTRTPVAPTPTPVPMGVGSVTPNFLQQGMSYDLLLQAKGIGPNDRIEFGTGIAAQFPYAASAAGLRVHVTVAPDAPLGRHDVTIVSATQEKRKALASVSVIAGARPLLGENAQVRGAARSMNADIAKPPARSDVEIATFKARQAKIRDWLGAIITCGYVEDQGERAACIQHAYSSAGIPMSPAGGAVFTQRNTGPKGPVPADDICYAQWTQGQEDCARAPIPWDEVANCGLLNNLQWFICMNDLLDGGMGVLPGWSPLDDGSGGDDCNDPVCQEIKRGLEALGGR